MDHRVDDLDPPPSPRTLVAVIDSRAARAHDGFIHRQSQHPFNRLVREYSARS